MTSGPELAEGFDHGLSRPLLRVHPEPVEGLALSPASTRDKAPCRNRSAELTAEARKKVFKLRVLIHESERFVNIAG